MFKLAHNQVKTRIGVLERHVKITYDIPNSNLIG